ncbi:MAG: hypothetical protein VX000_18205, partial [Myxococcota bacterium]|nr:hypothetical protein [Myxococcota bacterium]
AEQFVPGLDWDQPGIMIPKELWSAVLRPTVADEGTCPVREVSGTATTYRTYNCRSSQGYEFTGEVTEDRWDASGWAWERYDFDVAVMGDVDDASFDRITLRGAVVYVDGVDDSTLEEAVLVNVAASAEGWLSRADADDPREPLWQQWTVTARYETTRDGRTRIDGDAILGGLGAVHFQAAGLGAGCAAVPDGDLRLEGQQRAVLAFAGDSDCRRCAAYTLDGSSAGEACSVGQ